MSLNLTKMSPNGQIVIPAEIRKRDKLKPSTQFIVMKKGKGYYLEPVSEEEILRELEVMEGIDEGMKDLEEGRYVVGNTEMSFEEFDKLMKS